MYSSKEHGFFSHFGQSRHPVRAGGRLGHGVGDQGRHQDRGRLDRRRLDGRIRFPRGAGVRLHLQGARGAQHRQQSMGDLDLPGHRARRVGHVRGTRPRFRHSGAARRRQRLSRRPCGSQMGGERARAQSRADADRIRDLSGRRAFDLRRSVRLSAEDRIGGLAARRSGDPAEEPSDRAGRCGRRNATPRPKRKSSTR